MLLEAHTMGSIVLIEPHGSMVGGPDSDQFRELFKEYVAENNRKFVLDLSQVDRIASPGIGMIVGALATVKNAGGTLKVCGLSERNDRVFHTVLLWRIVDIYEGRQEAVESFSKDIPTVQQRTESGS
jgi:anti-sigma B factor antagonist